MVKKCPTGFICTDRSTIWFVVLLVIAIGVGLYMYGPSVGRDTDPKIIVVSTPAPAAPTVPVLPPTVSTQMIRPELYPEPVQRLGPLGFGPVHTRGPLGPIQQVGILTAEGGSSNSAAPDRTILPLFGRELDPRRSRWNYYTRTDGANPVQVPVRVRNRLCDDDTNGCDEVYNDDSVHVPALGRSFKATIYRRSMYV